MSCWSLTGQPRCFAQWCLYQWEPPVGESTPDAIYLFGKPPDGGARVTRSKGGSDADIRSDSAFSVIDA